MANETKVIEIRIDLLKGLEDIAKLQQEISKLEAQQKANTKATVEQKNAYAANSVTLKEYRSQLNTLIRESANEVKTTIEKVGYIQKLKAEVSNLTLQYERLSKAELESSKGTTVLNDLKGKREELAKLNQAYGNYGLNVGNYSSATKMLGINLGQVMKEMPNFAISARIGIMSLTNNLPMLAESIKAVRLEQQQLIAAGKQAPSMFGLIAKSVFGLTGIMSIAMVLFQIFAEDIAKWVVSLFKGEQAVKGLTNAQLGLNTVQETLNKTMKDGGGVYATAISDIDKLKVSLEKSKGSTELSKKALNDYNESLGHTFGKAKNVDEALKLIRDNEKDYVLAMQKMAFANAFFSQSAADALKIVEVNTNKNAEILGAGSKKYIDEINKAKKAIADAKDNSTSISEALTVQYAESNDKLLQRLKNAEKAYNDAAKAERERQIKEISNNQKISLTKAREYYNEYADIYSKNGWSFKENEDKKSKRAKETFDWEQILRQAKTKEIKDDEEREISTVNDKYAKLTKEADDAYKKDLSKKKEYDELIILYERDKQREISDIQDKYVKKQLDALEKQNRQIESGIKASIRSLKSSLKEEFNDTDDSVNLMIQNQTNMYSDMLEITETNIDAQAKVRHAALNLQMAQELSVKELTEQQKLAITEKYRLLNKKVDETALNEKINMVVATAQFVAQALGEESKAGKAAAATAIGIQALQSAWAFGKSAASYFIGNPLLGIPPNPLMGALATLEAAGAIASGYAQIAKIYAVKDPDTKISAASGSSTTKSSVTEKFHTGTYQPASKSQEQEITRTLLTTERILSPQQTGIFDNILGNIRSLGGTNTVMSGVGIGSVNNAELMKIALQQALQEMPQPQVEWVQFKKFEEKMNQFEQNRKNF